MKGKGYTKMIKKKKTSNITLGTNYDFNKDLVEKYEVVLTEEEIKKKKETIADFIEKKENNFYFMLLCHEKRDYTLFNFIDYKAIDTSRICADEIVNCLNNRGKIKGIDVTKDNNAIEIWISNGKEAFVYYFFPYDSGVIEIDYRGGHTVE